MTALDWWAISPRLGLSSQKPPALSPDDFLVHQVARLDAEDPAVRAHLLPDDGIRDRPSVGKGDEGLLDDGNDGFERKELLQLGPVEHEDVGHRPSSPWAAPSAGVILSQDI
jgi:hypothetical protein